MRVYLDNCCYNRPYDDQSQNRVHLEAQAKMQIQHMIKNAEIELVTSFVLDYENSQNRSAHKRQTIADFMNDYETYYVSADSQAEVVRLAEPIMASGVKQEDAYHVACALLLHCDYFITVDDRLLKYQSEAMPLLTPIEFMNKWRN